MPILADKAYFDKEKNLVFLNEDGEIFIVPFEKERRSWQEKKVRYYLVGRVLKSPTERVKRFRLVRGEIYFADQESDRIIISKIKNLKGILE